MPPFSTPTRALAFAALLLGSAAAPAAAQGTAEQQEACTPDALKFCSATIPDIPKTTACMKAHVPQLTPRCRAAFADAAGAPTKAPVKAVAAKETKSAAPRTRLATRDERPEPEATQRRPIRRVPRATTSVEATARLPARRETAIPPVAVAPPRSGLPGLAGYEASINRACREGLIDPFTCRNTIQALGLLQ